MLPRLTLFALFLLGCPASSSVSKPTEPCTRAYDQCTQPNGVLGVCDTVECAQGQPEPCLVCRSQH